MKKHHTPPIVLSALIAIGLIASSCVSQKQISYFQPVNAGSDATISADLANYTLQLKPGNIISVGVSSISPEANTMFNPYIIMQPVGMQNTQTNNLAPAIGYMVDADGAIALPMVGKVVVGGLSTKQAADLITQKLEKYLINPTVNVRMLNFTVSVLGEVVRPSVYNIPNERVTLPEALSLAGDLTIYGRRDNVLVIREVNGHREFNRIDLTKRDLFSSPFYFLQPNDVVYVEPGKGKSTATDRTLQVAPTIISGLSLITLILSVFKIIK